MLEFLESKQRLIALLIFATCIAAPPAQARRHSPGHAGLHAQSDNSSIARDGRGRIKRSRRARNEFQRLHPCPATGKASGPCLGYVVDHVMPLKRGGADSPSNMQWQTREAAKQKDKWE